MNETEIRISLADMYNIIDSLRNDINVINDELEKSRNFLIRLDRCWSGKAEKVYRELMKDFCENAAAVSGALSQYPSKLSDICENYNDSEVGCENEAESLPDSIIE